MRISEAELDLLHRIADQRDAEAFTILVTRYQGLAYSAAMRVLGNRSDAEEITQECFIRLFRKASQVTISLGGWLHRCATDLAINLLKSKTRRKEREKAHSAMTEDLQGKNEWDDVSPFVDQALRELPEEIQDLMVEHFLRQKTQTEIAEQMGVSASTVSRHIEEGVQLLREKLKTTGIAMVVAPLMALIIANATIPVPPTLSAALGKMAMAGFKGAPQVAAATTSAAKVAAAIFIVVAVTTGIAVITAQDAWRSKPETPSAVVPAPPGNAIGWRGDGTGRYPDANPPAEWYVRVKNAPGFACIGRKPKSEPASLERTTMFSIKDWVVLAPFEILLKTNPHKAIYEEMEKETVPNEAGLQASEGDKQDKLTWKKIPMQNTMVNLAENFGPMSKQQIYAWDIPKDVKIAYAYTSVYCDRAGKAKFRITGQNNCRVWINGKLILSFKDRTIVQAPQIELQKGWNSILVKIVGWSAAWNFYAWIDMPVEKPTYEEKNIAWKVPMSGFGVGQPITVAGKIYVTADSDKLLCLNKNGQVEWIRSSPPAKAMWAQKKDDAAFKSKIEPLLKNLEAADEKLRQAINSRQDTGNIGNERSKISKELETIARETVPENGKRLAGVCQQGPPLGWACGVPCSDGERVFVWYHFGVAAAYGLSGDLKWINWIDFPGDAEHGYGVSPILIDGKFIITQHKLTAFDVKTGQVVWKEVPSHVGHWGSNARGKAGNDWVVVMSGGTFFKTSDGSEIFAGTKGWDKCAWDARGSSTPIVENNVCYYGGDKLYIMPLRPGTDRPEVIKADLDMDSNGSWSGGVIASPLYHDGLVYVVTEGGRLGVYDGKTGAKVYTHQLDACTRWAYVGEPGVCASLALAGKNIYSLDCSGVMNIFQPGRKFQQVGRNVMCDIGQTLTTPTFDADRIYIRTPDKLYCIAETSPSMARTISANNSR